MRKITTILILLISTQIFSQDIHQGTVKKNIVGFINDNIGKKVGDGCCRDLPMVALGLDHKAFNKLESIIYDDAAGNINSSKKDFRQIFLKQIQPGDIITFDHAKDKNGNIIESHMGIVYKVVNDSTIVIAEQNVGEYNSPMNKIDCGGYVSKVYENSMVLLTTINLSDYWRSELYNNHIAFHRF